MSKFIGKMYGIGNSSQLNRVGWVADGDSGIMRVEFSRGGIYEYTGVSKEVNDGFWKSSTKGKYFHSEIKKGEGITFIKIS